jgi:hypothetical protein
LCYALLVEPIEDSMAVRFEIITTETHGRSRKIILLRMDSIIGFCGHGLTRINTDKLKPPGGGTKS